MIDTEIAEFGKYLGIPDLSLGEKGVVAMRIGDVGDMSIERVEIEDEQVILFSLGRTMAPGDLAKFPNMLRRVNWRNNLAVRCHAAVSGERLILSAHIPEAEVTASTLDNTLRTLLEEFAKI